MTMAQVIEKTGAGEGNRTLVISLEALPGAITSPNKAVVEMPAPPCFLRS